MRNEYFCLDKSFDWRQMFRFNALIDQSLSVNEIEIDLWYHLVILKCEKNFLQHIRSNQRNFYFNSKRSISTKSNDNLDRGGGGGILSIDLYF